MSAGPPPTPVGEDEALAEVETTRDRDVEERGDAGPQPERGPRTLSRRALAGLWIAFALWAVGGALWLSSSGRDRVSGTDASGAKRADLAVLVVRPAEDSAPAVALLHVGASSKDLVLLPAGTIVEVPGVGPRSLASALSDGGPDVLAVAAGNALSVRVPHTLVAGPAALRALVEAVGRVQVTVPEDVVAVEDGVERVLFPAGSQRMDAGTLARFLAVSSRDENQLERVARQNAAWRGLLDALRSMPVGPLTRALSEWTGMPVPDAVRMLRGLAGDVARDVLTLPVSRVGVSQEELYRIDGTQLRAIRAALADVMPPAPAKGRVRLLVGADASVASPVARLLVDQGFRIVLTGKAAQSYDVTRVVMSERDDQLRATAKRLIGLLGKGRLGLANRPTSLFDVTLVVGRDWADANGLPRKPSTQTP